MSSSEQTVKSGADEGKTSVSSNYNGWREFAKALAVCGINSKSISSSAWGRLSEPAQAFYMELPLSPIDAQVSRLKQMAGAENGWAGPGSIAPSERSLNAAVTILNRLKHLPFPVPMASIGSHGNAGLFWSDPRLYADVELLDDGKIGFLVQPEGGEEIDAEEDMPQTGLPPGILKALASAYLSNNR